jgi:hypothetical protein
MYAIGVSAARHQGNRAKTANIFGVCEEKRRCRGALQSASRDLEQFKIGCSAADS